MVVCGTAGAINGLFSAGGGMLLVPMLTLIVKLDEKDVFPTSVAVILLCPQLQKVFPICSAAFPAAFLHCISLASSRSHGYTGF